MRQRQKGGGYRSRSALISALPNLPKIDTKTGDSLIYQDNRGWGWYDGKELITDMTALREISNKKRKKVIESVRGMQTPEEKDRERQQVIERQRNAEQYNKNTIRLKTIEEKMRNTTDATEWDRLNKELSEIDYCSQIQFKNCKGSLRGQSALLEDGKNEKIELAKADIQNLERHLAKVVARKGPDDAYFQKKLTDAKQHLKQLIANYNPPDGHQQNKMLICECMDKLQSSNDTNEAVANKRNKEVKAAIRTDLKTFFDSDHEAFDRWKAMEAHFEKQLTVDQALNNYEVPGGTDYILTKILANDGVVDSEYWNYVDRLKSCKEKVETKCAEIQEAKPRVSWDMPDTEAWVQQQPHSNPAQPLSVKMSDVVHVHRVPNDASPQLSHQQYVNRGKSQWQAKSKTRTQLGRAKRKQVSLPY
jgi:hypothetical protein